MAAVRRHSNSRTLEGGRRLPRSAQSSVMASVVRLGAGALSIGADEVRKRLVAAGSIAPQETRGRTTQGSLLAYTAVALAIDSAQAISHWMAVAMKVGRRSAALADTAAFRLPGFNVATVVVRRPLTHYRDWIRREGKRGRLETARGRRLVTVLVRDATRSSFNAVTGAAVKQVATSPEIAALVRTQSAGIATGAVMEVRENSEEADDRVERRVRSWLHILRPESDAPAAGVRPHPEQRDRSS